MISYIQFGSKKIEFYVEYSNRKTLGISVNPKMEVIIRAPVGTKQEKIKEIVRKKAPWIIKQQGFFLGFYPKTPDRKYISGETHLYLGRQYKLRIIKGKKDDIHFKGRELQVHKKENSSVKKIFEQHNYISRSLPKIYICFSVFFPFLL